MVQVDWARPALEDLKEVYEFIARDSPRYAQLTVERVTDAAERLAGFPNWDKFCRNFPILLIGKWLLAPTGSSIAKTQDKTGSSSWESSTAAGTYRRSLKTGDFLAEETFFPTATNHCNTQ